MLTPIHLPQGHHELAEPVVDCEVDLSNLHLETVVLTASIAGGSNSPISAPLRGRRATTLAFRMDEQAAIMLHARLTQLGQTMGWLPATKGQGPS